MRNVMVRCVFSTLILGVWYFQAVCCQYRLWTDQEVVADEWQPFVPSFPQERHYQPVPVRTEVTRQFFGKNADALGSNSVKKSFQASSPGNSVDPFLAVPSNIGVFNTFGLQSIQGRNPNYEKNVRSNQQQYPPALQKFPYQTQQNRPVSAPVHFQYNGNHQHISSSQYNTRGDNKQVQQSPSRSVTTQVFPPNHQHYFLGPKQYPDYESPPRKQQQNKHDFLLDNNIPTIYGVRDPSQNIPPPTLKSTQTHSEPTKEPFLFDNRPHFDGIRTYYGGNKDNKKQEDHNPGKQVYEQLAQFSRPFSLPQETNDYFLKNEKNIDPGFHLESRPVTYHKEKLKPSQPFLDNTHSSNLFVNPVRESQYIQDVPTSTSLNLQVDYEPSKLQSSKAVAYLPQSNLLPLQDEQVTIKLETNPFTKSTFLPTPTEAEISYNYHRMYSNPTQESPILPQNHKHSKKEPSRSPSLKVQASANKYVSTSTELSSIPSQATASGEEDIDYDVTTKKLGRRRKPTKNKNKEFGGYRMTYTEVAPETSEPTTRTTRKKKVNKPTTPIPDEYLNYPNYPQYVQQNSAPERQYENPYTYQQNEDYNAETANTRVVTTASTSTTTQLPETTITSTTKTRTRPKFGNSTRPRFSIKDYKSKTTTPSSGTETTESKTNRRFTYALRSRNQTEPIDNDIADVTEPSRKYKPKVRINRYKTTTTASPDTTTERVNTFKPSTTGRLKSNTSKYYNRLRSTTTESNAEQEDGDSASTKFIANKQFNRLKPSTEPDTPVDDADTVSNKISPSRYYNRLRPSMESNIEPEDTETAASTKIKTYNKVKSSSTESNFLLDAEPAASDTQSTRTNVLFSAKRSLLRPKPTTPKAEDEVENALPTEPTTIQYLKFGKLKPTKASDKVDDASETDIMTSSEEESVKAELKATTPENLTAVEDWKNMKPKPSIVDDWKPSKQSPVEDEERHDIAKDTTVDENDKFDIVDEDWKNEKYEENEEEWKNEKVDPTIEEVDISTEDPSSPHKSTKRIDINIEEQSDDEKVSQVSALTSVDESELPLEKFFRSWSSNDNQSS